MDSQTILIQFEEIEQRVGRLLGACKALEEKNQELDNKVMVLEGELQAKVNAENVYAEEKTMIRSKIDSLLARLEEASEED